MTLLNDYIEDSKYYTTYGCSCCDDGDSPDCDNGFDPQAND